METPIIWMYWEDHSTQRSRPAYLDLCLETIQRHCSRDFQIHVLNPSTVHQFLPDFPMTHLNMYCSIPQKTDYLRLQLLYTYGGIWLDADILCFRSLLPYWELLKQYDYVGFGCYYADCEHSMNGEGNPANWVMISRPQSSLLEIALQEAKWILFENPNQLRTSYHCLGKDLLRSSIQKLKQLRPQWTYYHVPSECVERTSAGIKITNTILLSETWTLDKNDKDCYKRRIFLPLYNTAPGFPSWFLKWSRHQLLHGQLLICQYFKYSLSL